MKEEQKGRELDCFCPGGYGRVFAWEQHTVTEERKQGIERALQESVSKNQLNFTVNFSISCVTNSVVLKAEVLLNTEGWESG